MRRIGMGLGVLLAIASLGRADNRDSALCTDASRERTLDRAGKGDRDAGADQYDAASGAVRAEAAELDGRNAFI